MKIALNLGTRNQSSQRKAKHVAFREAPIHINGELPMFLSKHRIQNFPTFIRPLLQNGKVEDTLFNIRHNTLGLFVNLDPATNKVQIALKKLGRDCPDVTVRSYAPVDSRELLKDDVVERMAIQLKKDTNVAQTHIKIQTSHKNK